MRFGKAFVVSCLFVGQLLAVDVSGVDRTPSVEITADEVVGRMLLMDKQRSMELQRYEARRRYIVDNKRFSKHAEMEFREQYSYPSHKTFDLLSEEGTGYIRHKVIQKMVDAELDSVTDENRDQTKVTAENYEFRLLGTEEQEGRLCYVMQVSPKKRKKYLMEGRVWVDQQDFAIVRMEGRPAKSPSFWTRDVHFVRRYKKHGPFWLTDLLESESSVWIAGKSTLTIEYSDYAIYQASYPPVTSAVRGTLSPLESTPAIETLLPQGLRRAALAANVNGTAPSTLVVPQFQNGPPQEGRQP
jgi:hypothetical protein